MPYTNYSTFCFGISALPGDKCISFPGGQQLCVSIPSMVPITGAEMIQDLLGKLNSAMAPLTPIFNIIDAVLAVFECIKAIATLDPVEILNCIPNLAQRVNKLLELIPQLSIPILVRDFIECLIVYLEDLKTNIQRAKEYLDRVLEAEFAAANSDVNIGPIIDCATGDLDELFVFMGEQGSPINRIIGIINSFLQLIGLPCIPNIGAPSLDPGFLTLIDKLITFLKFLQSFLNIPFPAVSIGVDADDC